MDKAASSFGNFMLPRRPAQASKIGLPGPGFSSCWTVLRAWTHVIYLYLLRLFSSKNLSNLSNPSHFSQLYSLSNPTSLPTPSNLPLSI